MAKRTATKPLTDAEKKAKKEKADQLKRDNFVRMFEARVTKACRSIELVGNCAGAGYIYTKDQASQGITAMANKIKIVADRFNKKAKAEAQGFKLTDVQP